jgi:hypothetical protein
MEPRLKQKNEKTTKTLDRLAFEEKELKKQLPKWFETE